jgi:hypothetical protein
MTVTEGVRCQKTEDRGQRTEDRSQRTESIEVGSVNSEGGMIKQRAEDLEFGSGKEKRRGHGKGADFC